MNADVEMSGDDSNLEALLNRIESGEADLYLNVVRRHELSLRCYLAGQVYDQADVDDLAQEAFIAAYRNLSEFRRGEDFGAWLRGIARNRLLTHFRSRKRRAEATERFRHEVARIAEEELEGAARANDRENVERVLQCISRLPEKLRRVVRSGLDGAKPATLAEELKTSVPAIYQLHYRANQLLRACMNQKISS
jgi:RNA polymerase sigma-70 factor (ECF subfamily)